jgi:hypothetical protein
MILLIGLFTGESPSGNPGNARLQGQVRVLTYEDGSSEITVTCVCGALSPEYSKPGMAAARPPEAVTM